MDFSTIKALHIIFVVSWFAGLFYIVRLFIYHTEAQEKSDQERTILSDQFQIMEHKLWWIITTPAMILSVLFGVWMILLNSEYYLSAGWFHIKLAFVIILLFYHFKCQLIIKQLKNGIFKWNSNQLRLWNELATLVLVAVIFLVELQNNLDWIKATLGFFGVALGLMIGIKIYKRFRLKTKR
ncbi:MAG: CopD family protein [Crocinitomicaceae bacterium]